MAYRASDMDRHNVAERLRAAAGDGRLSLDELEERLEATYGAKTYGELEPLLADLPGETHRPTNAVAAAPSAAVSDRPRRMPVGGRPTSETAIAIFGGASRKGPWVVPKAFRSLALFGGIELDLREATLEDNEVTIYANAVFGGVEITVPDGVQVRTHGAGIFGGFDGVNDAGTVAGAPVVHVKGIALFGGVEVRRRGLKGKK
jgi:hypothetical protein